jgi:hypothetical protein
MSEPAYLGTGPVATAAPARPQRRLDIVRGAQEPVAPARVAPGQLPTFERAYLMRELRQIGVISTSLLGLIIALTLILR